MGRLVKIDGKTIEIQDISDLAFEYTDHNGKKCTIDRLVLHDPILHQKLKFTTIQSVLKWWVANRENLLDIAAEMGWSGLMIERVSLYFDLMNHNDTVTGSYSYIKDRLYGHLRRKSLSVSFGDDSENFVLYKEDSFKENSKYNVKLSYLAKISLREQGFRAERQSLWEKHYNYTFKMAPEDFNFFRSVKNESNTMFGMELEVCTKLTTVEIQKIVTKVEPKQEPFFIFKQDSSITGKYPNLLELVTVPCTPRYLRKNWKIFFQKLEKLCREQNMQIDDVFDTSKNLNNGLHIHVSNESFNDKPHYKKFLTAWNQWNRSVVNLFNTVADRPTDYTKVRYCKVNHEYDGKILARRLKGLTQSDRMTVAHSLSGKTIEVRVYQGIFDIKHIMRCISFTEAMFEFCSIMGYSDFDKKFVKSMSDFVRSERKYASLYEVFTKVTSK